MRLLMITDYPIDGGQYIPNWMNKMATVDAGQHRVSTIFAHDLVDRYKEVPKAITSLKYTKVMIPASIKEIDEIYIPIREAAIQMLAGDVSGIVEYEDTH